MVKQSRAVDKGLAGISIPACPVHVTSNVNKSDPGVLKSRCQVPEHAYAFLLSVVLNFPNLEFREYFKARVRSAMM
jgi:hypothetical protein